MKRYGKYAAAAALAAMLAAPEIAQAGKADDTLVWTTTREIAAVDPYYHGTREMVIMSQILYDQLVFRDVKTGEFKPLLGKSWEWKSPTVLEFVLRDDVKFHDGSSFDADDVVYTLNHTSKKSNGVVVYRNTSWVKNAEKLGSHKVRINLRKPFPAALAFLANGVSILPSGHWDNAPKKPDGKPDYIRVKPIGTGPYIPVEVKAGEYVLMKKNPNYFSGSPKGTPQIGYIKFRTIKEVNTQIAELLTGGVNWIWDIPKAQAVRLKGMNNVVVENAKTFRISYIQFDVTGTSGKDMFTKKKVRQAVAHAINKKSISDNLVGDASVVIHSACHPDQFGCTQDVPKYDFNPAKAKALLKEAGYPNGFETDLYAYRQREFTEAVIGDLANVGIKVKFSLLQYRALRSLIRKGTTPIQNMTWGSYSIPDVAASTSNFFKGSPDDRTMDKQVKEYLDVADNSVDPAKRKEYYKKAHTRIAAEAFWVPLFTYAKYYGWSSDLNLKTTPDEIPRFYSATWK
ncbi:MAG: ABC transporter substrate-binding protein [Rhodospirillales bacterium]|jgi:peptide/nickel transport system substrate-binding protein